jgi:hypothetical protein
VAVVGWRVGAGVGGVGVGAGVGARWCCGLGCWGWLEGGGERSGTARRKRERAGSGVGVAGVGGRSGRVVGRLGVVGLDGAMETGEARAMGLEVEEFGIGLAFGSGAQVLELVLFIGIGVVELVKGEVVLVAAEGELGEARVVVGEVGLEAGAVVEEAQAGVALTIGV